MFDTVYVYYPRGYRTGGPEALHQLVHALRGLGQEAYLVPIRAVSGPDRVAEYDVYDAPEAEDVEDRAGVAVVAPELLNEELLQLRHATGFRWWLSIDWAPEFADERGLLDFAGTPADRRRALKRKQAWDRKRDPAQYRSLQQLAQSAYAWSFLTTRLGVVPTFLSDYIPLAPFDAVQPVADRGRTVAYYHLKSHRTAEEIARRMPDVDFTPIRDMGVDQVLDVLARSAVYLDTGPHPGKDRMPREAALAGAVSVIGRRGSGAFWSDVPVPARHRLSSASPVESGIEAIQAVLHDPAAAVAAQADYVAWIRDEQRRFTDEVRAIFLDGRREFGPEGP